MSELHGRLMQLAEQLSPPLRKAFQLRDVQGLTTAKQRKFWSSRGTVKPGGTGTREAEAADEPSTASTALFITELDCLPVEATE